MALCHGLAPGDPNIAKLLVEERPRTVDHIMQVLANKARPSEDSKLLTFAYRPTFFGINNLQKPPTAVEARLWRQNQISWIDGVGKYVHSDVVAATGNTEEVVRRIRMGQQMVFVPIIEQVRSAIVEQVADVLGTSWFKLLKDISATFDEESLRTELNQLSRALYSYCSRKKSTHLTTSQALANQWRKLRNKVAHGCLLDYEEAANGLRSFRKFVE